MLALMWLALGTADETWQPTEADTRVYKALSVRDPVPSCQEIAALVPEPVAALKSMVEHATLPPWVPMRAATCLVQDHAADIEAELFDWVSHPEKKGLAILVFQQIDRLPEALSVTVATRAIAGPHAVEARKRLPASRRAAVRGLAATE